MRTYYIYRITNLINQKTYIGQRKCPENKAPETDSYMGSGDHIRRAEKKYGIDNFRKEILARNVETKEMIDELEISYIKYERMKAYYGIIPECYNIADGGNGSRGMHWKLSAETRAKMSERMKGKPGFMKGKHQTVEWIEKKAAKNRGQHRSAEVRAKMSAADKGRIFSAETRTKISEANKGHETSAETRTKISEANKGKYRTPEQRAKMSAADKGRAIWNKGKHFSEETKAKMSAAAKRRRWHLDENGKRVYTKEGNN